MQGSAQWVMSLGIAFVAICTGLALFGFHGRVSTVGIDLGTTFSVVGVRVGGKVKIIEDDSKNVIFPSVVSYLDDGEVLVGYDAISRLKSHPEQTVFNAKRFIGRKWDDENVQAYAKSHPYRVKECDTSISNYSTIAFEIPLSHSSKLVSPEQIGSEVLKYLRKITNKYLGHEQVSKAVIAVPAKFTSEQRAATGEAYRAAGLKVVRVIEEPTAAAVAYDLHKKSNVHHILVYDFGGGTLDVSLLYVAKGSVQVYATDGDDELGGSDLDMCLFDVITSKISDKFGLVVHDIREEIAHDTEIDYRELCVGPTIRQKAEQVKKDLSSSQTTAFTCQPTSKQQQRNIPTIQLEITREEFQGDLIHELSDPLLVGCRSLFDRSMLPVSRLLTDLGMSKKDIDEVVLVGGTTRIPLVKDQLRKYFDRDDLNDKIDPDVTVAYGAASILD